MSKRSSNGYVRLCHAIIAQARRDGDTDFFRTSWYELLRDYIANAEDLPTGMSGAVPDNMQVCHSRRQFNGCRDWDAK
jgi:hypothetical protein